LLFQTAKNPSFIDVFAHVLVAQTVTYQYRESVISPLRKAMWETLHRVRWGSWEAGAEDPSPWAWDDKSELYSFWQVSAAYRGHKPWICHPEPRARDLQRQLSTN
jgi:hypothetical protein